MPGYFNISLTPLVDSNNNVYAVLYVSTEITDEILSRKKVEEAEAVFRGAVELAELGTWTADIATGTTVLSQRHADMFGFEHTVLDVSEAMSVIIEEDKGRVVEAFINAQKIGSGGKYEAEYQIVNAMTGRQHIIHSHGQTYFDAKGIPVTISGTAQDVTMRRELQTALENQVASRTNQLAKAANELRNANAELGDSNKALTRSNEELAQYAYVASHDLQEPLRKIRFFAGILKEGQKDAERQKIFIDKISSSAERMSQLIKDLLDFSRLLQPDAQLKPVDLNETVKAVFTDFELVLEEKQVEVEISPLPEIKAVSLQMNQLFYNLISNSLKFAAGNITPKIRITSELINQQQVASYINHSLSFKNYHHIQFIDNGIGFDTKYSDQIFEIFKRLHGNDIYPGSGIGLALCRRIVSNHKGFLLAESEIGKGSIFHIFLPAD